MERVSPLRIAFLVASLLCLSLGWTFGCTRDNPDDPVADAMKRRQRADATARLAGSPNSGAHGFVRFLQDGDTVRIIAELAGVPPGAHGFHVHERGDCSAPDFSSAGDHFSIDDRQRHALPSDKLRHTGDLGNIVVDGSGTAAVDRRDDVISLQGERSIIGRALIVHEHPDDGVNPLSSGGRILCGVIERVDLRERTSRGVEKTLPALPPDNTIPPLTPPAPPVVP